MRGWGVAPLPDNPMQGWESEWGGGGGKKKRDKGIQKVAIFSKKCRFLMFSGISRFFFGGHFWKYKPPRGLPGTNPGFLETQISAKSQGLKTVWSIYFNDF